MHRVRLWGKRSVQSCDLVFVRLYSFLSFFNVSQFLCRDVSTFSILQILIRRWGILWRPLQVAFRRRAALIGCCMRLHNFCIQRRISEEDLPKMNGEYAVPVPGDFGSKTRWRRTPLYRDGRPVPFMDMEIIDRESLPTKPRDAPLPRSAVRDRLIREINRSGLKRPPPRRNK